MLSIKWLSIVQLKKYFKISKVVPVTLTYFPRYQELSSVIASAMVSTIFAYKLMDAWMDSDGRQILRHSKTIFLNFTVNDCF